MPIQTDKLRRMFDSDSKLMIETLTHLVGEIRAGDDDPAKIDRAFRAAHSIKSEAGFLQLSGVSEAAHTLEESLATLRANAREGASGDSDHLSRNLEKLTQEIDAYRAAQPEVPSDDTAIAREVEVLGASETGMLREARSRGERLFRVDVVLTCDRELFYPRGFLVVNNLEMECAVVQTSPSLDALKAGADGKLTILLTSAADEDGLRRMLSVDEVEVSGVTELTYEEVEGEFYSAEESPQPEGRALQIQPRTQEEILLLADELSYLSRELSNVVGDMRAADERLSGITRRFSLYSDILKRRVDSAARVQLLDVFRGLRDGLVTHAAKAGRRIRYSVSGSGAVVFAAVADSLTDAILHVLRNSIDHGIDTIGERARKGKPPAGTIAVEVEGLRDSIRIRISDDGAGVDEAGLRRKTGDNERSLVDILATPGFSRRAAADTSSGRGVGLDSAVHTVRDLLSGGIEMESHPGRGMVTNISIPQASRLLNVVVVEAPDGAAAIPASLIVEDQPLNLRRFKRDSFGGRYYDFRGESLPLLTLLGGTPEDDAVSEGRRGIVVRSGDRAAVLLCNRVVSREAVVRDDVQRRKVYSRKLAKEIPFVFPPAYLLR